MGIKSDYPAICFLLLLYFLQGLPLGLTASMVFLFQEYGISYEGQAVYSVVHYPFAFKFLWSGMVDSFYIKRFGRRKSWLFPVQMLISVFLFYLSGNVQNMLNAKQLIPLTILFFCLNFLVATQDVCVDGWALTLLSEENAGAAANCNAAGQAFGSFVSYGLFMALYSPDFCNKWIRTVPKEKGVITINDALLFYAVIFFVITVLIALFKKENNKRLKDTPPSIIETYKTMGKMVFLKPVKMWFLILFTRYIGLAASGELAMLKMTERGLSRASMALLSSFLMPIRTLLPVVAERLTTRRTMDVWFGCCSFQVLSAGITPIIVFFMPKMVLAGTEMTVLTILGTIDQLFGTLEFVSVMSFHAQVSDPLLGGVYMTILNSAANFGAMWPESLVLWLADNIGTNSTSKGESLNRTRLLSGEQSLDDYLVWDPYYALSLFSTVLGICWLLVFRTRVKRLEKVPKSMWRITASTTNEGYVKLENEDE